MDPTGQSPPKLAVTGSLRDCNPDRIVLKKIVLTGEGQGQLGAQGAHWLCRVCASVCVLSIVPLCHELSAVHVLSVCEQSIVLSVCVLSIVAQHQLVACVY